jgi:hypothetical protein
MGGAIIAAWAGLCMRRKSPVRVDQAIRDS